MRSDGGELVVLGRDARSVGHAAVPGAELGFEGHLLHDRRDGAGIARALLRRFLDEGLGFVDSLDGSFQIVIRDERGLHLVSDAHGTRRPFFAWGGDSFYIAPRASLLRGLDLSRKLDPANVVQFLLFGRFFAGECALQAIRQPRAGEIVTFSRGRLERSRWYRYSVAGPAGGRALQERAALHELAERVDRAIIAAFRHASAPAVLLSGGYDSRYLLNVLLRAGFDRGAIRTVSWGIDLGRPGSDCAAAAALARRAGIQHVEIARDLGALSLNLDAIFEPQSAMTELAVTHADELAICTRLAAEHGIDALLRGDEVFGPTGPSPSDIASARAVSAARPLTEHDHAERWFVEQAGWFAEAHRFRVTELLQDRADDAQGLRDGLYADERLPAFLNQLSCHKLPALEIYNPLLSRQAVDFYRALPSWCRADKALFKRSYHARFDDAADVPITTGGNALDWAEFLRTTPAAQDFVRAALARLPPPLCARFFIEQLDAVIDGENWMARLGESPSPAQLAMRGVVLSWWLAGE